MRNVAYVGSVNSAHIAVEVEISTQSTQLSMNKYAANRKQIQVLGNAWRDAREALMFLLYTPSCGLKLGKDSNILQSVMMS